MNKLWLTMMGLLLSSMLSLAHAAELTLGGGDVLKVNVYNHPDLSVEARVNESGSVRFPLLGEVALGGLSVTQAEKKIAGLLDSGKFIPNPQVSIIVTVPQSQLVSVLGQVNRPGRYPLDARRSLADLLALAGGTTGEGGDVVTLMREREGKREKFSVDVLNSANSPATAVMPGDVVYVERAPRFYIYGEVQRAGSYRLERNMTVLQALSLGGGLSLRGTERGLRLKRLNSAGVLLETDAKLGDFLLPDDVVFVREALF
jgi:polysaccharide biosynthesis/export protein